MNSCQPLDISTAWEKGRDLLYRNLDEELLVPEDDDIPLSGRVGHISVHCLALGKKNVIVVSIHVNAAGNGTKWLNATGWSVFTCSGQTESDRLAECLCESAIKNFPGRRIRTEMSDGDRDWEKDFYILRKSWCPAVLTENFFMDSRSDLEYLQSRAGKQAVVDTHVEGIIESLCIIYMLQAPAAEYTPSAACRSSAAHANPEC